MRPRIRFWMPLFMVIIGSVLVQGVKAIDQPLSQDIIQGARLYDNWYAALNVLPPAGNMPIWARQTTNSRSGGDTWRCVECHGWDYRGSFGAYGSGSH